MPDIWTVGPTATAFALRLRGFTARGARGHTPESVTTSPARVMSGTQDGFHYFFCTRALVWTVCPEVVLPDTLTLRPVLRMAPYPKQKGRAYPRGFSRAQLAWQKICRHRVECLGEQRRQGSTSN